MGTRRRGAEQLSIAEKGGACKANRGFGRGSVAQNGRGSGGSECAGLGADVAVLSKIGQTMCARALLVALFFVFPLYGTAQTDTGPAGDVAAIHHLIEQYAKAVDTVDLNLLSRIWAHTPEVSFVYPLGEERGFEAIEQHVFKEVMGGMFTERDLKTHAAEIHVNGDGAWAEFHWVFHATLRKDGSAVTTRGVETQIYRKERGTWHLVHVHYSEERPSGP